MLHNVTSGLCNYDQVRKVLDDAITGVCLFVGQPVPEKKPRGKKNAKTPNEAEEETAIRPIKKKDLQCGEPVTNGAGEDEEVLAAVKSGKVLMDDDSDDEAKMEEALSTYDGLLGGSSDEEDPDDVENVVQRGKRAAEEDMSLSGSASPEPPSVSLERSQSASPPPAKKKKKEKEKSGKKETKEKKAKTKLANMNSATTSVVLPKLSGGYISGSESASDVDLAPPKKRLGQRQRQAKWEKKYGANAKHVEHPSGHRDAGWDMKRGAIEDDARGKRPGRRERAQAAASAQIHGEQGEKDAGQQRSRQQKKPAKDGPVHPSWEAARKAKEAVKPMAFQGKRVVFD